MSRHTKEEMQKGIANDMRNLLEADEQMSEDNQTEFLELAEALIIWVLD